MPGIEPWHIKFQLFSLAPIVTISVYFFRQVHTNHTLYVHFNKQMLFYIPCLLCLLPMQQIYFNSTTSTWLSKYFIFSQYSPLSLLRDNYTDRVTHIIYYIFLCVYTVISVIQSSYTYIILKIQEFPGLFSVFSQEYSRGIWNQTKNTIAKSWQLSVFKLR